MYVICYRNKVFAVQLREHNVTAATKDAEIQQLHERLRAQEATVQRLEKEAQQVSTVVSKEIPPKGI